MLSPDTKPLSFFDHILGSAARNDFSRNALEAVKKHNDRFLSAYEGLCPFNPHAPFKKGSILNFYDFLFREGFHSRGSFGGFQAPQRALENTGRSDR